jgi:7-carboxy-7-deazaguanine synthase (Cx14CxxC type)
MSYLVKEIFLSVQGEGLQAGKVAVFLLLSGCNMWSGREADRGQGRGGCSRWCDTDFVGDDGPMGGRYQSPADLASAIRGLWPAGESDALVICTGGEPLLQLDAPLIDELHQTGFKVAIESNGTIPVPKGVNWTCISPKAGAPIVVDHGDELKLVYPQEGMDPARFERLEFEAFILQPMDGPQVEEHTRQVLHYCLQHPRWRVGLQTHKILNLK